MIIPTSAPTASPERLITISPIWKEIAATVEKHAPGTQIAFNERFPYYDRSRNAFAVVQTGETALYANVILKKGVIGK